MDLLFIPSWRAIAVRGALAILFGFGAFLWPSVPLAALVVLFGTYALLDGLVAIMLGSRMRATDRGWLLPLEGFLGVDLGFFAIVWTGATTVVITMIIGAWALLTGVLEVVAATRLRQDIPGEGFLAFGGVASIALGGILVLVPGAGSLVLVILLGSYALIFGAAMLMLAMRLRDHEHRRHPITHAASAR